MSKAHSLTPTEKDTITRNAVRVIEGAPRAPYLLTCEHASHAVPTPWHNLGLSESDLKSHIGWDIGAARVTELLAAHLSAPAIFSGYSRLFVECNRVPEAADFVIPISAGIIVPGNQNLSADDRLDRKLLAFDPFHDCVAAHLDHPTDVRPAVLSIHSFTAQLGDTPRPWHAGVLWKQDDTLAQSIFGALQKLYDGPIGYNQPYDANLYETMTVDRQILPRGLRHVVFEIRNDLIDNEDGCQKWANLLASSLQARQ